jgi:hypothetical protein
MQRHKLQQKYSDYENQGHLILGVTLSTYITSDWYAKSDRTRQVWDHHFIGRVLRRLPSKPRLDHDYVLEKSPDGFWHYHGLLAVSSDYGARLWKEGALNSQLKKDITGFRKRGRQRPFTINSFRIEPLKSVEAWCNYITKQQH